MSRYVPQGTYTGDELRTQSLRPGAYDALQLPSRMGNRQISPAQLKHQENAARAVRAELPKAKAEAPALRAMKIIQSTGHVDFLPPETNTRRFVPLVAPEVDAVAKPMATFGEVAAQHKRLQESEAALGMWRAHVASLITRADFLSQLEQLRGHAPAIDTPPFHNAA